MIKVKTKGNFKKTEKYLAKIGRPINMTIIKRRAEDGLIALKSFTPVDSGKTRDSWYYMIKNEDGKVTIQYCNSNVADYVPIAIILQYGHATGTGGWVEGIDYINPAIRPVFEDIKNELWKEVTS